jgi:hypothetical protein
MNYDYQALRNEKPSPYSFQNGVALIVASLLVTMGVFYFFTFNSQLHYIVYLVPGIMFIWIMASIGLAYYKKQQYLAGITAFVAANHIAPLAIDVDPLASRPPVFYDPIAHNLIVSNAYVLNVSSGNQVGIYDYQYSISYGRSEKTYNYSIATFSMSANYPHMYLDGKANHIKAPYARSQRVALEGQFDSYFNLYIPDGEQIDALSIITPDIMQTLMDTGRPYDIEINNSLVYICSSRPYYTPTALPHLLAFVDRFDAQIAHRNVSWQAPLAGSPAPSLKPAFLTTRNGRLLILGLNIAVLYLIRALFQLFH